METRQAPVPVVREVRGRPRVYLEVIPQGNAVRVQPVDTDLGRSVNRFWTVWLRHLILEKTDQRHTYGVELRDNSVIITSSATQEGLAYTVMMLAREIRPIRQARLHRIPHTYATRESLIWEYEAEWGDRETQAAGALVLPRGARLHVLEPHVAGKCARVELHCSSMCELRKADVGKIVELHFALCVGDG